jgi:hypothetical protein
MARKSPQLLVRDTLCVTQNFYRVKEITSPAAPLVERIKKNAPMPSIAAKYKIKTVNSQFKVKSSLSNRYGIF